MQTLRLFELALAAAAGYGVWYLTSAHTVGALHEIASAFAAVAGTLLGFAIAALSILTAVVDRRLVVNLRKTGHYSRLLSELYYSATGFLVALLAALVCLFLSGLPLHVGVATMTAAMVFATALLVSAGRKFAMVMEHLT